MTTRRIYRPAGDGEYMDRTAPEVVGRAVVEVEIDWAAATGILSTIDHGYADRHPDEASDMVRRIVYAALGWTDPEPGR